MNCNPQLVVWSSVLCMQRCCLRVSLKQSGHCPLTWTRHFHPKNCCSLSLLEHSLHKSNWWFFGKIPLDNQFLNGMAVGARWFGASISKLLKSPFFLILQLFLFKPNILNLKQMFCTHIRWTEHGRGKPSHLQPPAESFEFFFFIEKRDQFLKTILPPFLLCSCLFYIYNKLYVLVCRETPTKRNPSPYVCSSCCFLESIHPTKPNCFCVLLWTQHYTQQICCHFKIC